jgi:hypothetical protein
LEDEADVPGAQIAELRFVERGWILSKQAEQAGRRLVQRSEQIEQRAFSAAAGSRDGDGFSRLDRQADAPEDVLHGSVRRRLEVAADILENSDGRIRSHG